MTNSVSKFPMMFIVAWILTTTGTLCLATFLLTPPGLAATKGIGYVGAACISIGVGEILNHPKKRLIVQEGRGTTGKGTYGRRRNICALGNLLIIVGLLLFCIGLAQLLNY